MAANEWEQDRTYHESLFPADDGNAEGRAYNVHREEIKTTPLFSADVLAKVLERRGETRAKADRLLPQYGLLAKVLQLFNSQEDEVNNNPGDKTNEEGVRLNTARGEQHAIPEPEDRRLFVNMNAPWSAFICGSQGSGKSHTLSCMLEAALHQPRLGKLSNALAGMVFHYDKFSSFQSTQICEAACLSSSGIPVKVLVSPSSFWRMEKAYGTSPRFAGNATKPVVAPLILYEKQLNVERMVKLMAADEKDGKMPLYMESVKRILRSESLKNKNAGGVNFANFEERLKAEKFNENQRAMLDSRIQLLKSFFCNPEDALAPTPNLQAASKKVNENKKVNDNKKARENKKANEKQLKQYQADDAREIAKIARPDIWDFDSGGLTIVDLSCPFVDEGEACVLFNICLTLFLEGWEKAGRIVALDEAHKFMTATSSSSQFTESLLKVIREQRHYGTRVIVATQEPTISPALLDLSSMTLVHRFTSPSWLATLKSHLAGVSTEGETSERDIADIFKQIVSLQAGQALLFSPSAMVGVDAQAKPNGLRMRKLGVGYQKISVRKRLTQDGGQSVLAT